jgi:hypothetical protein
MTVPAFDHDYWRAHEPVVWTERKLHWHCYGWRGSAESWNDPVARRSESSDIAPFVVRLWLERPARMIRAVAATPEEGVTWLRGQWAQYGHEMVADRPEWIPDKTRFGIAVYDLRCGNDICWGFWLSGGGVVSIAVVGLAAPCHQHHLF